MKDFDMAFEENDPEMGFIKKEFKKFQSKEVFVFEKKKSCVEKCMQKLNFVKGNSTGRTCNSLCTENDLVFF